MSKILNISFFQGADMSNTFLSDGDKPSQLFSEFLGSQTLGTVAAVPVLSLVYAQSAANQEYLKYVKDVLLDENNQLRTFDVQIPQKNAESGQVVKPVSIPLLAILTHPAIAIQDAKVEYTVNVVDKRTQGVSRSKGGRPNQIDPTQSQGTDGQATNSSNQDSSSSEGTSTNTTNQVDTGVTNNPLFRMGASISCSSERKRSTDTSASLAFVTNITRVPPSEGMNRLIDALLG
jgi:hypothetical protein